MITNSGTLSSTTSADTQRRYHLSLRPGQRGHNKERLLKILPTRNVGGIPR